MIFYCCCCWCVCLCVIVASSYCYSVPIRCSVEERICKRKILYMHNLFCIGMWRFRDSSGLSQAQTKNHKWVNCCLPWNTTNEYQQHSFTTIQSQLGKTHKSAICIFDTWHDGYMCLLFSSHLICQSSHLLALSTWFIRKEKALFFLWWLDL